MILAGIHVEYMWGVTRLSDAETVIRLLKMDTGLRRYDSMGFVFQLI